MRQYIRVCVCARARVGQLLLIKTFVLKVNASSPANGESYQQRLSRLEGDKESLILQVRTPKTGSDCARNVPARAVGTRLLFLMNLNL